MSKITKALVQAAQDKKLKHQNAVRPYAEKDRTKEEGKMKNSWLVWLFVIGVVVTVAVAFNYEKGKNVVPLSEIFQEESIPVDVEYEIVKPDTDEAIKEAVTQAKTSTTTASASTKPTTTIVAQPAPSPKAEMPSTVVKDYAKTPFTVQVASFKEETRAQKVVDTLKSKGYVGQIVAKNLGEQGIWNRVYVGQFNVKAEADEFLKKIKNDFDGKIDGFVISPQTSK